MRGESPRSLSLKHESHTDFSSDGLPFRCCNGSGPGTPMVCSRISGRLQILTVVRFRSNTTLAMLSGSLVEDMRTMRNRSSLRLLVKITKRQLSSLVVVTKNIQKG